MATHRFDVLLLPSDGLPENVIMNSWHFDSGGLPIITDYDNVRDMLRDFYVQLEEMFAGTLVTDVCGVRAYNLEDPEPRAPVYESFFSWAPAASEGLPTEVAICASFHAQYASGEVKSRYRNRKYLGPIAATVNADGALSALDAQAIGEAMEALADASAASVFWQWVQYSPFDLATRQVTGGWVDTEFDTQRRRGRRVTSRYIWSADS